VFYYLYNIYGGNDIRRFSIELGGDDALSAKTTTETGVSTVASV
jgi:hypothetical protein